MICRVVLQVDGERTNFVINARSTFAALIAAIKMVPEGAGVKAVVSVITPAAND